MADHRPPPNHETRTQADGSRAFLAGILATGLAAAVGAVLVSYVGVQGTVAGAMVGAMVVSLLSQAVRWPLDRLERWLVGHSLLVVRRRQTVTARAQAVRVAAARRSLRTPRGWRVLLIGAAGFVVGMAAISGFELVQGKPLSATTAGPAQTQAQTGTTVGNLIHTSSPTEPSAEEPTPAEATPSVVGAPSPGSTSSAARPTAQVTRSPASSTSAQATQAGAPARPTEATSTLPPPVPATPEARLQTPVSGPTQAPTTRPAPPPATTPRANPSPPPGTP